VTTRSGSSSSYDASGLAFRERSTSMHTLPTTVVSQAARLSIVPTSCRDSRSQASCTASSASAREPSMR
jgi:hypothetical protein